MQIWVCLRFGWAIRSLDRGAGKKLHWRVPSCEGILLTHIGDTDTETKPGRKDLMPISRTPNDFSSNIIRNWAADAPVTKPVDWGIDSDVGRLREIILCAPDYWGIDQNANAVVKAAVARGVEFDVETAKRQHRNLFRLSNGKVLPSGGCRNLSPKYLRPTRAIRRS